MCKLKMGDFQCLNSELEQFLWISWTLKVVDNEVTCQSEALETSQEVYGVEKGRVDVIWRRLWSAGH